MPWVHSFAFGYRKHGRFMKTHATFFPLPVVSDHFILVSWQSIIIQCKRFRDQIPSRTFFGDKIFWTVTTVNPIRALPFNLRGGLYMFLFRDRIFFLNHMKKLVIYFQSLQNFFACWTLILSAVTEFVSVNFGGINSIYKKTHSI